VGETGSLALVSCADTPFALNFLADRLLVVLRESAIVLNLEDFWQRMRQRFGTHMPRALSLVSGPSTSGDVEMQFATGVHGPIEVHALIVP
jgi:L-lactate dehydrogenase complex protein LldG